MIKEMEIFLWSFLFDYDTKICKKRTISLMFPAFLIIVFFHYNSNLSEKKTFFSFYFADGPTFLYHPRTTSGDRLETITLHCIVDSNPPPQYYWTKGSSREVRAFSDGWATRRVGASRFRILEVRLRNWFEDGLNQELFFIFWYRYMMIYQVNQVYPILLFWVLDLSVVWK